MFLFRTLFGILGIMVCAIVDLIHFIIFKI